MQLHLKDNHPKDKSQIGSVTEEYRQFFRFLSSHSLQSIKDDKGCKVLVFPHSFADTPDDIKDATILGYTEDTNGNPEYISTGNLVGFIGSNGVELSIHSRFSTGEGEETKDYFLFYMLEKVLSINLFNLPTSASSISVFDFLLFFFPKMLKEALSQGLYKKYVYHEYNDANISGVIDVNRHIRHNIPNNGRIAYRTREFSYDNPITQLIRHTIEFIRRNPFGQAVLNNDAITKTCVQQIIQATPSFVPRQRQSIINDNLRPLVHPYYTKYAALQKLCLSILRHERLSYDSKTNDNKIHGILIDVAWLWEEYLALVLTENGSNLKHYTQKDARFYLFQKDTNKQFQQIIPDYYDGGNLVADAKYIPLHNSDHLSADRAAAVYYKTIMYMYRFNSTKGYLFHPCSSDDIKTIKNNPQKYGHISTDNNVVFCDYEIVGRNDCHLYEVGMIIPSVKHDDDNQSLDEPAQEPQEQYSAFKEKMDAAEKAFAKKLTSS